MKGFIIGKKSKQTQVFGEKGDRVAATLIDTHSIYLVGIVESEKNGYKAIQLAGAAGRRVTKPAVGLFKKAGVADKKLSYIQEFRLGEGDQIIEKEGKKGISVNGAELFVGDEVKANVIFNKDEAVTVTGISKGKGFQGVVKRHGFKGGSKTHGQSDRQRAPGSIGMTTTPGRVFKGKRMAGRMGNDTVTIEGLRIVEASENSITVSGLVPGAIGGLITIESR